MARYQKQRKRQNYPIGSVSCGTMRPEDLIPTFVSELDWQLRRGPSTSRATRKANVALLREVRANMKADDYFESEAADWDLDTLFDALGEYAAPYFYFGAHPSDGADYGYWLSEDWKSAADCLIVSDLSEVPDAYRGELAVISDHGNVTLYVKTSRTLREVWSIV